MKNKALRIGLDIALIVIGIVFLIFGIKDAINYASKDKLSDNVQFSRDYPEINEDNIYKYMNASEASKMLESGSGVLLLGKKSDTWMHVLVSPLNDILKENVENINYLDMDTIDENDYKSLEEKIELINSPCIVIIKNGEVKTKLSKSDIIPENFDGAPIEYFTDERIASLKEKLKISELN